MSGNPNDENSSRMEEAASAHGLSQRSASRAWMTPCGLCFGEDFFLDMSWICHLQEPGILPASNLEQPNTCFLFVLHSQRGNGMFRENKHLCCESLVSPFHLAPNSQLHTINLEIFLLLLEESFGLYISSVVSGAIL